MQNVISIIFNTTEMYKFCVHFMQVKKHTVFEFMVFFVIQRYVRKLFHWNFKFHIVSIKNTHTPKKALLEAGILVDQTYIWFCQTCNVYFPYQLSSKYVQ